MDRITVLNLINYIYTCSNCGSDSEGPACSIRVEIYSQGSNFGFNLCPRCAASISSIIHGYAERFESGY